MESTDIDDASSCDGSCGPRFVSITVSVRVPRAVPGANLIVVGSTPHLGLFDPSLSKAKLRMTLPPTAKKAEVWSTCWRHELDGNDVRYRLAIIHPFDAAAGWDDDEINVEWEPLKQNRHLAFDWSLAEGDRVQISLEFGLPKEEIARPPPRVPKARREWAAESASLFAQARASERRAQPWESPLDAARDRAPKPLLKVRHRNASSATSPSRSSSPGVSSQTQTPRAWSWPSTTPPHNEFPSPSQTLSLQTTQPIPISLPSASLLTPRPPSEWEEEDGETVPATPPSYSRFRIANVGRYVPWAPLEGVLTPASRCGGPPRGSNRGCGRGTRVPTLEWPTRQAHIGRNGAREGAPNAAECSSNSARGARRPRDRLLKRTRQGTCSRRCLDGSVRLAVLSSARPHANRALTFALLLLAAQARARHRAALRALRGSARGHAHSLAQGAAQHRHARVTSGRMHARCFLLPRGTPFVYMY